MSENKLVKLERVRDEPDPAVVERCEELLKLAKAGTLRGLSFVALYRDLDGVEGCEWASTVPNSRKEEALGCVVLLQSMLVDSLRSDATDTPAIDAFKLDDDPEE